MIKPKNSTKNILIPPLFNSLLVYRIRGKAATHKIRQREGKTSFQNLIHREKTLK